MTDEEAAFVEYMMQLHQLEEAGERNTIVVGPYTAIVLIGALQLASRHPAMSPRHLELIGGLVDQFRPLFAGTMGETMINRGADPANDVQVGRR